MNSLGSEFAPKAKSFSDSLRMMNGHINADNAAITPADKGGLFDF